MIILKADKALNYLGYDIYSHCIKYMADQLFELYETYYTSQQDKYPSSTSLFNFYMNIAKSQNNNDYVVIKDNKIIGYCNMNYNDFKICDFNNINLLWLSDIYVWPEYRSKGIATEIINKIKTEINEDIYLSCKDDMIKYYEKRGFTMLNKKILNEWNIMKYYNNK